MVTAAKNFCSENPLLLNPSEVVLFLDAVRSILIAEEKFYKYISLRVS